MNLKYTHTCTAVVVVVSLSLRIHMYDTASLCSAFALCTFSLFLSSLPLSLARTPLLTLSSQGDHATAAATSAAAAFLSSRKKPTCLRLPWPIESRACHFFAVGLHETPRKADCGAPLEPAPPPRDFFPDRLFGVRRDAPFFVLVLVFVFFFFAPWRRFARSGGRTHFGFFLYASAAAAYAEPAASSSSKELRKALHYCRWRK